MFRLLLKISGWILLLAIVAATLAFSSQKMDRVRCDSIMVLIPLSSPRFIDEVEIARYIREAEPNIFNKTLNEINTEELEQKLKKVPAIKHAEVYQKITGDHFPLKGKLVIEIAQRNPIIRIMGTDGDYYMDEEGIRIPATEKYTVKVTLANGFVDENYVRDQMLPFARFVYADKFWKAQVEQVFVQENGELTVVPRVGDHQIEFGTPQLAPEKFRNIKAIYQQEFKENGWNRYDKISVKYKNQVVCTKKEELWPEPKK